MMSRRFAAATGVWGVLLVAGCDPYKVCDVADPEVLAGAPPRLSETGLTASDVVAYEPRFALWSDGADKRRWIRIPPGGEIDTSDMDDWRFPLGTRLWKQFARDGVPLETRMLEKIGDGDDAWLMVAYLWAEDGSDALIAPDGADDVGGTQHDVPSATACRACHDGRRSRVLGYSALQLDRELVVPGDPIEQAALGYLHANCSHCHNQDRPPRGDARCYDPDNGLDFRLLTTRLASVDETPTYVTAVGTVIEPGRPDDSRLIELVTRRESLQMPPLGTEVVDETARRVLTTWIEGLGASRSDDP